MSDRSHALVTRDHVLTLIIGILAGFIGGYYASKQDRAPSRQPSAVTTAASSGRQAEMSQIPPAVEKQLNDLALLLQERPDDVDLMVRFGDALYDVGQFEQAITVYEAATKMRPNDPNLLTDLGVCYRNTGAPERALELFDRASAVDPTHWQSKYNKAIIYSFDQQKPDKALEILRELKSDPAAVEAASQLERAIEAHGSMGGGV